MYELQRRILQSSIKYFLSTPLLSDNVLQEQTKQSSRIFLFFILNVFIEIKFTYCDIYHYKAFNSVIFSMFMKLHNHHHYLSLEHFYHFPQKTFSCQQSRPNTPYPGLWQPLIYFLSLPICPFWIFSRNEDIQHVVFCVWFLLLSIMFLRLIQY